MKAEVNENLTLPTILKRSLLGYLQIDESFLF
jgi:hypothetical protein